MSNRGHQRERDLIKLLTGDGWVCIRAAGSLGEADVVAAKRRPLTYSPSLLFVEVKSTAGGPYERFGPKDRAGLLALAKQAGAEAWLAWWPPCKPGQSKADALKWIPSSEWPQ